MAGQATKTKYKAALYCRLSRDDGNVQESSSIQTQKEMLARYARENGISETHYFIDDGFSGVSFERPAFQKMIAEIEKGNINCVITKDLSRLGRNYLETGVYIEMFFPEHHVRYIAINDAVDTVEQESADFTPFRNIINELYAKDTSKKVKSAKRARFLDGMYISTSAPYGYKKDPADRHRLVIDERYAPTVRMIFSLAKDGMGILQIRNYINSRHILRPSAVNPNGYGRYFNGEDDPKRYEWSNNSVRGILRNPVYAGHLVMGKRVRPSFKSHKSFSVLPENYKVVRDVHQPIVDPEDFELVQRMITSRRSSKDKPRRLENIFAGLIKCADCGYAMTLAKANRSPKEEVIDEYGYMSVTQKHTWYIAAVILGRGFIYRKLEWNDEIIERLIEAEENFWKGYVEPWIIPPPDGSMACDAVLNRYFHTARKQSAVALVGFDEKLKYREEILQEISKLEEEQKKIEQEVKLFMKDNELASSRSYRVSWGSVDTSRFDTKRFRQEQPEIYKKYAKVTSSRRFQIKAA